MPVHKDLDSLVPLIFFSAQGVSNLKTDPKESCSHLGYLVKDGFNLSKGIKIQRIRCSACKKRFGTNVSMYDLLSYQTQIRQLIYELIIGKYPEIEVSSRWEIPQPKISEFKKMYITRILEEHPTLLRTVPKSLPRGILYADETYMGGMGNSNTEINMVNADFQTLAAGQAIRGDLAKSIQKVFHQIPAEEREKLRLLVTDGEPSYGTIAMQANSRVIHVQQLHAKPLLGKVIINKYQKFGPHYLHYIIKTHWKAFKQGSHELQIEWSIKFIKGLIQTGRGRPKLSQERSRGLQSWRQKRDEYYSRDFKKSGTAKVYFNEETMKISRRAGATQWMVNMLTPVLKEFVGKCITSNQVESKHSQIKRKGASRKQQDPDYGNTIFQICTYLAETKHLPSITLEGRPLYKYLVKPLKKAEEYYRIPRKDAICKQLLISTYIQ